MKILTILGARPQFIKAATVSRVVEATADIEEVIVHTGQHFDFNMSQVFFDEMRISEPHYNLEISSLSHGAMTGRMLEAIENIIVKEKPDWVLVYGDTNSTLAGALAASKLRVSVAHVEAGLRSFQMDMPEEQNRILTDRISSILFCPTQASVNNLANEGYGKFAVDIVNVGDVMLDAAYFYTEFARKPLWFDQFDLSKGYILSTIHRAENTDNTSRLVEIVCALNTIHQSVPVVLPLHPRTRKKLESLNTKLNVYTVDPVGYLEMVFLLKNCVSVISDSGGLQKEAYFFKKPCLITRDETEWIELVECGANHIVGANYQDIVAKFGSQNIRGVFDLMFYGEGNAAQRIVSRLKAGI